VLVDVRPLVAPIVVEVIVAAQAVWARTVESYSAPDDVAAADDAVRHAVSREWLAFETRFPFPCEIYCDTADELHAYFASRKLRGARIPYKVLEERRHEFGAEGQAARLRCRRAWSLSIYHNK
jgi:hypothetical protein